MSAIATWLDYPSICLKDVFTIGTSGTFDDSVLDCGYVNQIFECTYCGKETRRYRTVNSTRLVNDDAKLEYNNGFVPELHFEPLAPKCDYCNYDAQDKQFTVYLMYGVIVDGSANIQSAYAHKTFGFGDISVSVDGKGGPSFSGGLTLTMKEYIARPVTLS